tara:strand:- start:553 stop:1644 length:1092 start_codon:yes stop_codon:yes gene_type:complete
MKVYLVGGAIRDKLLGLEPKENDWVIVNGNQKELLDLGYKQVGKKFPVFLHPKTSEEYALARLEQKTDKGHKGFKFDVSNSVTLEQDLLRRDLTINAIAQDENGNLIDPYNGIEDIEKRVIRHVSKAFCEDPLRVFRVARFCAKFEEYNFTIHKSTYEEMKNIVDSNEIETLSKERLWVELSKSFNTKNPWVFFQVLIDSKVADKYFPELVSNDLLKKKIIYFSNLNIEKDVFLSLVGFSIEFVEAFGFPKKVLDLYFLFNEFSAKFISLKLDDKSILVFLNNLDAFRRPDRLNIFLKQIQIFLNFHKINDEEKMNIFIDLQEIIKSKIEYGNLSSLSVEDIKKRIESININIINLVLSKKSK